MLRKLFPPDVCGVVVLMIGLSIIRVALPLFFGIEEGETAPARGALTVGIASLATMGAVTVTRAGHVRLYATMIGLLAGYAAAIATGEVDAAFLDQPQEVGCRHFTIHLHGAKPN